MMRNIHLHSKLLLALFLLKGSVTFSQKLSFSKDEVLPLKAKLYYTIKFPGLSGNNYFVDEMNAGGTLTGARPKNVVTTFDVSTLGKTRQVQLDAEVAIIKPNDYINITNIPVKDRIVSFFLSKKDDDNYPVYYQLYGKDGKVLKEEKSSIQINNSKIEIWNNKKDHAIRTASSFNVQQTWDGERLLTATTSKYTDAGHSVISVGEWDENMTPLFTADYNIPLTRWTGYPEDAYAYMADQKPSEAKVIDVSADKFGFIYTLVQSGNIEDQKDDNIYWVYQFKKSDKSYVKSFKTEYAGNMLTGKVQLVPGTDGTMYITARGREQGKKIKLDPYKVNSYFIGRFSGDGKLEKLLGGKISMDLLKLFSMLDDKKQQQDGYINGLSLRSFHVNKDGDMYVVWEQSAAAKKRAHSNTSSMAFGNLLVQYVDKDKKLVWQKPVFKLQFGGDYSGTGIFYDDDKLIMLYPDDLHNAGNDLENPNIEMLDVDKADRSLAGFVSIVFDKGGKANRTYVKWPADKAGYALFAPSVVQTGKREFVATIQKQKDDETFTIVKISF